MSIRSEAEKLLLNAAVTDGPEGTCWVVSDDKIEALRAALKEPTAEEVVADINSEVWNALLEGKGYKEQSDAHMFELLYCSDGNTYEGIEFMGVTVWDNQDTGIPWDDASDAPISSLRDFVLKQVQETIEKLGPMAAFCADAAKKGTV